MFGTVGTTNAIYARTNDGVTASDFLIPGSYVGSSHTLPHRAAGERGALLRRRRAPADRADHPRGQPPSAGQRRQPRRPDPRRRRSPPEPVHHPLHAPSRASFDAGQQVSWSGLSWTRDTPTTGTALAMSARSGNVAVPDGTWTAYTAVRHAGRHERRHRPLRAVPGRPVRDRHHEDAGPPGRHPQLQRRADLHPDRHPAHQRDHHGHRHQLRHRRQRLHRDLRLRHRRRPHRDAEHRLQLQRLDGSLHRHRPLLADDDRQPDGRRHLRRPAPHPDRDLAHGRDDHRHRDQLRLGGRRHRLHRRTTTTAPSSPSPRPPPPATTSGPGPGTAPAPARAP